MTNGLLIYAYLRISSYIRKLFLIFDFAPIPSELPYIWGKFSFLSYQCGTILLNTRKVTYFYLLNSSHWKHKLWCFQITKKDWVGKVSHLRKVRKSNKLFKSANLRNCGTYLRNLQYLRTAHLLSEQAVRPNHHSTKHRPPQLSSNIIWVMMI